MYSCSKDVAYNAYIMYLLYIEEALSDVRTPVG